MLRGQEDEVDARIIYAATYAPVQETGFVTNDSFGFTIGYSPDGLVGDDGLIECKSRKQKYQAQTIVENEVPEEYMLQLQTGLLVTQRKWIDFISYSGGMPMVTIRVTPDPTMQAAILQAATLFEAKVAEKLAKYRTRIADTYKFIPTERKNRDEEIELL
jgi:predicted phage-related endonuclease